MAIDIAVDTNIWGNGPMANHMAKGISITTVIIWGAKGGENMALACLIPMKDLKICILKWGENA